MLESWPDNSWPSTSQKDMQAILEVSNSGQFIVTIKKEDWNFFGTAYQNVGTPITISSNTEYKLLMYIKLNDPGVSNGIVRLWINNELKIDRDDIVFLDYSIPRRINNLLLSGYDNPNSPDNKIQYWDDVKLWDGMPPQQPPTCTDFDTDNYYLEVGCRTLVDCNDNNSLINPGATEICDNGVDEDCSGADLSCGFHDADNNPQDGCISMIELIDYIGRWKNNDGVDMTLLIEAIGIWKGGGC